MKQGPERTCIGCRGVFRKDQVIRIAAGPLGIVLDYREKLPGRAAYVCPRLVCIEKAMSRENLSRAFHAKMNPPDVREFTGRLIAAVTEKIRALVAMSAKAGKLAAGYSAVRDALEKGRVELLLYARDVSAGTTEKLATAASNLRGVTVFTRVELGAVLGREVVGVVGFEDKGLAEAVWKEAERLKSLINNNQ